MEVISWTWWHTLESQLGLRQKVQVQPVSNINKETEHHINNSKKDGVLWAVLTKQGLSLKIEKGRCREEPFLWCWGPARVLCMQDTSSLHQWATLQWEEL